MKRIYILLAALVIAAAALLFREQIRQGLFPLWARLRGRATVADRVALYGEQARARLAPYFETADLGYPPAAVVLVGLKHEKMLEVWARDADTPLVLVRAYTVLGTSGELGPKLEEGDMQVPEGVYRIESLNPNSRFHLSMRLDYPNEFDRKQARAEGRRYPGSDIMIHGKTCSIGCLAMGDRTIEELFVLAADTGVKRFSVVLAPVDFRKRDMPQTENELPAWTAELYGLIRQELARLQHRRADGADQPPYH